MDQATADRIVAEVQKAASQYLDSKNCTLWGHLFVLAGSSPEKEAAVLWLTKEFMGVLKVLAETRQGSNKNE